MILRLTIWIVMTTLSSQYAHGGNRKKYVIEIQDHQQAMKFANPIVDLEETVRRGINDPLADPRFVMNRINKDYFRLPLAKSPSENKELLSYEGLEQPAMVRSSNQKFMPSPPMQQNAVKNGLVPDIPNLMNPVYQKNQPLQNFKMFLSGLRQQTSPHSQELLVNHIPHINRIPQKQVLNFVNAQRKAAILNKLRKIKAMKNAQQLNSINIESADSSINPVTGLPIDLESGSYGAVSSITAFSENSNSQTHPATVTVNLNDPFKNGGKTSREVHSSAPLPIVEHKYFNQPSNGLVKIPEKKVLDGNVDSLKTFLEEDSILRDKYIK